MDAERAGSRLFLTRHERSLAVMGRKLSLSIALSALLIAVFTGTTSAGVPAEITVQGRLTNSTGSPVTPGAKTLTFKIFNAETAGIEIWPGGVGEIQTITTDAEGRWTAQVGSLVPIPDSVFNRSTRWLQITVYDGVNPPEILSRLRLTTSPYSYRVSTVDSASGGRLTSALVVPDVQLGSPTLDGSLELYRNGSAVPILTMDDYSGLGGGLACFTDKGKQTAIIEPDVDGPGGYFSVARDSLGNPAFYVDGVAFGTTGAQVGISGATRSALFAMGATDDNDAVVLPASSISAAELLDEPGIAANNKGDSTVLNTTAMVDINTVSVTIPNSGYIVVQGKAFVNCTGTVSANIATVQIDETSGGTVANPYAVYAGLSGYADGTANWFPVYVTRTYYKAAGTYTFRMEGRQDPASAGNAEVWWPMLSAVYYPTSYGSVTTLVNSMEVGEFEQAVPVAAPTPSSAQSAPSVQSYQVDLRELELKAARLTAEIERAKRELSEVETARRNAVRQTGSRADGDE